MAQYTPWQIGGSQFNICLDHRRIKVMYCNIMCGKFLDYFQGGNTDDANVFVSLIHCNKAISVQFLVKKI